MPSLDSALQAVDTLAQEQKVRAFDIYALGPFLIWAATRKGALGPWSRRTLFVAGCMTVIYNWNKYKALPATVSTEVQNVLQ